MDIFVEPLLRELGYNLFIGREGETTLSLTINNLTPSVKRYTKYILIQNYTTNKT